MVSTRPDCVVVPRNGVYGRRIGRRVVGRPTNGTPQAAEAKSKAPAGAPPAATGEQTGGEADGRRVRKWVEVPVNGINAPGRTVEVVQTVRAAAPSAEVISLRVTRGRKLFTGVVVASTVFEELAEFYAALEAAPYFRSPVVPFVRDEERTGNDLFVFRFREAVDPVHIAQAFEVFALEDRDIDFGEIDRYWARGHEARFSGRAEFDRLAIQDLPGVTEQVRLLARQRGFVVEGPVRVGDRLPTTEPDSSGAPPEWDWRTSPHFGGGPTGNPQNAF